MHAYTHTHIHKCSYQLLHTLTFTLYTIHVLSHTLVHVTIMEMLAYHTDTYNHIYNSIESEVAQSCLTLCDPMDCNLPGSSVHGTFQAGVLEWVAISSSRGSSQPRD